MSYVSEKTIKTLFAQNGNQCSFPGCKVPMVSSDGVVLGEICHIHARNKGGPRFNGKLTPSQRQSEQNLILLCGTHHKIVDDDPSSYQASLLQDIKSKHNAKAEKPDPQTLDFFAILLLNKLRSEISISGNSGNIAINSPGIVQASTVNIKQSRGHLVVAAPEGTIGARPDMSSYVQYLIKRYNEFARKLQGRERKFNFGAISKNLENHFNTPWRLATEDQFEEVCAYLMRRIDRTQQAKFNKSKGKRSYHTFDAHIAKAKG